MAADIAVDPSNPYYPILVQIGALTPDRTLESPGELFENTDIQTFRVRTLESRIQAWKFEKFPALPGDSRSPQ